MVQAGTLEVQSAARLVLQDGRRVSIRPVAPADAAGLGELYARCSDDSRFFRFHAGKPGLRRAEAEYLAGSDGAGRVALVATISEKGEERIVADARFDAVVPGDVEAALLVRDDFQGVGLGGVLLQHLVGVAASLGHRRLVLDILAGNHRMVALARRLGARYAGPAGHSMLFAVELQGG